VLALQARLAPKGTVHRLANKIVNKIENKLEAAELASVENVTVSNRPTQAISVGPEGLVYEEEP
jgi:hypothetical protein